ncbi:MAG TPA: hypothetical protein DDX39_11900 [Bacteroidales bacterium]|nr:MAG: hypothetical protein A2W98_10275 [Bacteroidetes bacterium GWF2_33_38]OFY91379.1 MAG: hypothetical protein A2236_12780 [Bacteroidetes bacterium RIFOXYA2_FULL_33_7]HBF89335.1 hypothetical protein [Bacteroidales bacterium]
MLLSCYVNNDIELKITERKVLKGVPSASGISIYNDSIFVIGDNSPWIFQLNQHMELSKKIPLEKRNYSTDTLYSKSEKPDYEAFEAIKTEMGNKFYLLGSGSKSPHRDVLLIFDYNSKNSIKTYSLEKFYSNIKSSREIDGHFLNIEALAIEGDKMFLFNRGKNLMLQYSLKEFTEYAVLGKGFPKAKIYEIELPKINGIEAGFSGATAIPNQHKIIFTASIENTTNPIDDGDILGSFVGIIDLNEVKNQYFPLSSPISENNEILKIKVESVTISKQITENCLEIILVTDSDGGDSEILKTHLTY